MHCQGLPKCAAHSDGKPKIAFIHVAFLKVTDHRRSDVLYFFARMVEISLGTKPLEDPFAGLQISGGKVWVIEAVQHQAPQNATCKNVPSEPI
ncbi:hypothetical protein X734_06075 [Mesorhizobium sp. L2C084A000]|nr:hypothetical protein X734_06075 [Mesorhizobium sp. L2C084A000]